MQSDIELLRRGIERAATRAGLTITDQETDAAFVVRYAHQTHSRDTAAAVVTVQDGAVSISTAQALDPATWTAVGRLTNELLANVNS